MLQKLSSKIKALFSLMLVMAMIVILMPVMATLAHAESAHTHNDITFDTIFNEKTFCNSLQNYYFNESDVVNAYLTNDVSLDSNYCITIPDGKTLNLCLNGYSITSTSSAVSVFDVKGTLNIYDCGTEIQYFAISNGKADVSNKLNDVTEKTEGLDYIKVTGGYITHLSSNSSVPYGIYLDYWGELHNPVVNMYGGNIIGIKGYAIDTQAGKFTLYGGTIQGNTASSGSAANINCAYKEIPAEFNIYGGEIKYNTNTNYYGNDHSAIRNQDGCTVNLSGKCVIKDNYYVDCWDYTRYQQANYYGLSGSCLKISESGLNEGSEIGIGLESKTGTVIASGLSENDLEYFTSDNDSCELVYADGALKLINAEAEFTLMGEKYSWDTSKTWYVNQDLTVTASPIDADHYVMIEMTGSSQNETPDAVLKITCNNAYIPFEGNTGNRGYFLKLDRCSVDVNFIGNNIIGKEITSTDLDSSGLKAQYYSRYFIYVEESIDSKINMTGENVVFNTQSVVCGNSNVKIDLAGDYLQNAYSASADCFVSGIECLDLRAKSIIVKNCYAFCYVQDDVYLIATDGDIDITSNCGNAIIQSCNGNGINLSAPKGSVSVKANYGSNCQTLYTSNSGVNINVNAKGNILFTNSTSSAILQSGGNISVESTDGDIKLDTINSQPGEMIRLSSSNKRASFSALKGNITLKGVLSGYSSYFGYYDSTADIVFTAGKTFRMESNYGFGYYANSVKINATDVVLVAQRSIAHVGKLFYIGGPEEENCNSVTFVRVRDNGNYKYAFYNDYYNNGKTVINTDNLLIADLDTADGKFAIASGTKDSTKGTMKISEDAKGYVIGNCDIYNTESWYPQNGLGTASFSDIFPEGIENIQSDTDNVIDISTLTDIELTDGVLYYTFDSSTNAFACLIYDSVTNTCTVSGDLKVNGGINASGNLTLTGSNASLSATAITGITSINVKIKSLKLGTDADAVTMVNTDGQAFTVSSDGKVSGTWTNGSATVKDNVLTPAGTWNKYTDSSKNSGNSSSIVETPSKSSKGTETLKPVAEVKGNTAIADVSDDDMQSEINKIISNNADIIQIVPAGTSGTDTTTLNIPVVSVGKVASETKADLSVVSEQGSITIPNETIPELVNNAKNSDLSVTISTVKDISTLSGVVDSDILKNAEGVTVSIKSGSDSISSFGGKGVKISFPVSNAFKAGNQYILTAISDNNSVDRSIIAKAISKGNTIMLEALTYHFTTFLASPDDIVEFTDVNDSDYFADAVSWAVTNDVTSGITATAFGPNADCTRAEFIMFLYRAAGSPKVTANAKFVDVSSDAYYADAVAWAVENGITNGISDTEFGPNIRITRAQAVTFLYKYAGSSDIGKANPFSDVESDMYYTDAVIWASAQGITTGTSYTMFSPDNICTRAQVVTFLYREFNKTV